MRVDSAVEDAKKAAKAKLQGASRRSRLTRGNLNLKARVPQTPTALLSFYLRCTMHGASENCQCRLYY
jgi:hypothetical protein